MKTTVLLILAVVLIPANAAAGAASGDANSDTLTTRITDLEVSAPVLLWGDGLLSGEDLQHLTGDNLAENVAQLPGVAAVRRAASAAEPVIRGLGWERVRTILGAVPLYGACPGRMDPPATYITALSATQVSVFRQGGGSTFGGPGGTAGTVVAKPDYERPPGAGAGTTSWLGAGFNSAREGVRLEGGVFGGTEALDFKLGAGHRKYDDFTAPDGTVVPAGQTTFSVAGSAGWRPRINQRLWYAGTYARETEIDFPAMPMDNIATDFWVHNIGWRTTATGGLLRRLELTGGLSLVDHFMDNSLKPNRNTLAAATDAMTRSGAAHAVFELAPAVSWRVAMGVDVTRLSRDATRTRTLVASGMTFRDRLWPQAVQTSAGGFANLAKDLTHQLTLNLSGRLDVVDSKARAADTASLGGLSVREQYVNFYGEAAAGTDRTETLGQFDVGLRGTFQRDNQWFVRSGLSTRGAGITERYYAFGPAPGGYQVGNPTLAAEKKWEGELGLTVSADRLTVAVTGFHAAVTDFILPTVIERRDVNGDDREDTIKGFGNVDASLSGGEFSLEYRPLTTVHLPVSVSYVRGRNTSGDRDLPEIPPLFGSAEIRWRAHHRSATWLHGGCTFAADQNQVDPLFPEDRTGGYAVWRAGLSSTPRKGWRLDLRLDNILDRLYHDHLDREAVLPVGGLTAGQEIPAPGRRLSLTARWEF